jgi:Domain of unknown function (DUF4893)
MLAMRKILIALFTIVSLGLPAHADGVLDKLLTDEDKARLANFQKTEAEALQQSLRGNAEDVEILTAALAGKPLPLDGDFDPTGNWRCRVIKAGGDEFLPLVVYGWFKCRISDDGSGWFVEKISGSQRTTGRLYTKSATELVYAGAGHVNDDPPRRYGDDSQQNQVAIVTRRGENKLVFMFPEPVVESKLDVMVMERGK